MGTNAKSDTQLRKDVVAALRAERRIGSPIAVDVQDGIVTLSGCVRSHVERWEAERVAERVFGITLLEVEVDVIPLWLEQAI